MEEADMVDHQDTVRIEDTEITAVITVPEIVKEKDTEKEIAVLVREIITESVVGAERGTRSTGNITRTGTDTGRGTGTEKGCGKILLLNFCKTFFLYYQGEKR